MKVAITGASGHVGANLVRLLLEKGIHCRLLHYKDSRSFNGLDLEIVKGNLSDIKTLKELVRDCDYVFHLAARISITHSGSNSLNETNIDGTSNLVDVCIELGIRRLIHFSSIHAFCQLPLSEPLTEDRESVQSDGMAYDISKARGEDIVKKAVRERNLDAVILNPTSIIGPLDFKPSLMGGVFIKLFNKKLPALVRIPSATGVLPANLYRSIFVGLY